MKILLLSAYHAASHKYWCEGLTKNFPEYEWTELTLSPRYFAWRMRGNPLSWTTRYHETLAKDYDLIVATSMVDLACLRGLMPNLSCTPAILYFHENQFVYPLSAQANSVLEAQLVSLYAALSAQRIVFNSQYNQRTFLCGVDDLIKKFPDEKPLNLSAQLDAKSVCLAVPLDLEINSVQASRELNVSEVQHIVWNHRWEYDKGPDRLLALVEKLTPELTLCFHIVGQQFREHPEVFARIKTCLDERNWLGTWGYVDSRADYLALLERADFVVSTALHDFQGLAVLEACALGCIALAPARLAYPEFLPAECLYPSNLEDIDFEANAAARLFEAQLHTGSANSPLQQRMASLCWSRMQKAYRDLFESTAGVEVSCASQKSSDM